VRSKLSLLTLFSPLLGFADSPVSPTSAEALKMTGTVACENSVLGISSTSSDGKTPTRALCLRASNCRVLQPFNYRHGKTVTLWSTGDSFLLTYACEAKDSACPSAETCAAQAEDENSPYRWAKAVPSAKAAAAPPNGRVCQYTNPIEPRALIRALDETWEKVDIVCASTVTCRPALEDPIAISPARRIDATKAEIECPSATEAVAERFPLDKPKANVAAQPPRR
jgi:hypothetical protein